MTRAKRYVCKSFWLGLILPLTISGCAAPPSYESYMAEGNEAAAKKDWANAERLYNHAVTFAAKEGRQSAKYAESCYQLGCVYENQNKPEDACQYLEKALAAEPDQGMTLRGSEIFSHLGSLHMGASRSLEAENAFSKALLAYQAGLSKAPPAASPGAGKGKEEGAAAAKVAPETIYARKVVQLASLHMAMKKYKQAEKEYQAALATLTAGTDKTAQEIASIKREIANAMRGQGRDEEAYDMDRRATGTEVQGIKDLVQMAR